VVNLVVNLGAETGEEFTLSAGLIALAEVVVLAALIAGAEFSGGAEIFLEAGSIPGGGDEIGASAEVVSAFSFVESGAEELPLSEISNILLRGFVIPTARFVAMLLREKVSPFVPLLLPLVDGARNEKASGTARFPPLFEEFPVPAEGSDKAFSASSACTLLHGINVAVESKAIINKQARTRAATLSAARKLLGVRRFITVLILMLLKIKRLLTAKRAAITNIVNPP
jgi:hypothetical protein